MFLQRKYSSEVLTRPSNTILPRRNSSDASRKFLPAIHQKSQSSFTPNKMVKINSKNINFPKDFFQTGTTVFSEIKNIIGQNATAKEEQLTVSKSKNRLNKILQPIKKQRKEARVFDRQLAKDIFNLGYKMRAQKQNSQKEIHPLDFTFNVQSMAKLQLAEVKDCCRQLKRVSNVLAK